MHKPYLLRRTSLFFLLGCCSIAGCASQYGHILAKQDKNLVGSHAAGAATWNPLVDASVAQLLGRCPPAVQPVTFHNASTFTNASSAQDGAGFNTAGLNAGATPALATGPASVCFIGIENKSAEELGDFKDQLYQRIDTQINSADTFQAISRRMVDTALLETRLRPDALFLPANRAAFAAALGRQGSPVDYLLYATVTSGTTDRNKSSQRDYEITLEMVNMHTGEFLKESAKIRKGYSKNRAGKWWNYGWFDQADG